MSSFGNKLLKSLLLNPQLYLTSTLIHNDTTSDSFINAIYELDLPSIDNEWEDYAGNMEKKKADTKATCT